MRVVPALAMIAFSALYANLVIHHPRTPPSKETLSLINAPGWRLMPPPQNWRAAIPHADRYVGASYANRDGAIYLYAGFFDYDRPGAEIVTHDNRAADGAEWRRIGAERVEFAFPETNKYIDATLLAGPEYRRLAVARAYWLGDKIYLSPIAVKFAQLRTKLFGVNKPGGVLFLAAQYDTAPEEAAEKLRAFTASTEPLAHWLQRNQKR